MVLLVLIFEYLQRADMIAVYGHKTQMLKQLKHNHKEVAIVGTTRAATMRGERSDRTDQMSVTYHPSEKIVL